MVAKDPSSIGKVHDDISKGVITSKIKHAIKLKTRLAQLLQPSLAFCFAANDGALDVAPSLLQAKTKC